MWNMRDEVIVKLMDGVYKAGVLGAQAQSGRYPGACWCVLQSSIGLQEALTPRGVESAQTTVRKRRSGLYRRSSKGATSSAACRVCASANRIICQHDE